MSVVPLDLGYCRFCNEVPDGDRVSFIGAGRNRCNKPQCVRSYEIDYDRTVREYWQREARAAALRMQARKSKRSRKRGGKRRAA